MSRQGVTTAFGTRGRCVAGVILAVSMLGASLVGFQSPSVASSQSGIVAVTLEIVGGTIPPQTVPVDGVVVFTRDGHPQDVTSFRIGATGHAVVHAPLGTWIVTGRTPHIHPE